MNILIALLISLLQIDYNCPCDCVPVTPSPTAIPSPTATATPANTATPLPTPSPTTTATPQPAITPTATPAPVVTINFQEDVNAIFGNPYIGFESTQRPINEVSNPRNIPSTSIEFGQYMNEGFANIDAMITKARASNQTILLRLAAYDPDYGQYLKNIFPGFNFKVPSESSSGPHFAPDLNNAQVLNRVRSDLAAFGARYNNNPTIEHVDWRLIGLWGEQHNSGTEPLVPLPSEASSNHIYQSFQLAFPSKQKIAILDGKWARKLAVATSGVGLRMDCWGGDANHEGPGNLYQQWYSDPPAVADIWKDGPVVLEPCGALSSGNITNKVNLAIARHASLINTKNGFNVSESQWPEWQRLLRKLGYRFVLRRAVINQGLTLHIENVGIAPNYKPLRVENATTGLAVTLSEVMPGETRLAVLPGNRGDVIRFSIDGKAVRTANSTYSNGVLIP